MSGKFDRKDVQALRFEARKSMSEAINHLEGKLEAEKYLNQDPVINYSIDETKEAIELIQKATTLL